VNLCITARHALQPYSLYIPYHPHLCIPGPDHHLGHCQRLLLLGSHIRIVFAPFTCNMRRTAHCKNEGVRFSTSWSNPQVKWHCLCCQWRTARATLFRRFSTSWSTFQVKWHCLCCQWRTARDTVFRSCSPSHMAPIWAVPESFSSRHMHMSPTSASTMCPYNYVSR